MWNFQFHMFIDYMHLLDGMAKFPQLLSNRLLSNFGERLFQNPINGIYSCLRIVTRDAKLARVRPFRSTRVNNRSSKILSNTWLSNWGNFAIPCRTWMKSMNM